jgi:predicted kinase
MRSTVGDNGTAGIPTALDLESIFARAREVIVLRGLPGAGKTTWAKSYQALHPHYKRISRDDLRDMVDDGARSEEREAFIRRVRDMLILEAVVHGFGVIVDGTHPTDGHITHICSLVASFNIPVRVQVFDTPVEECVRRDATRTHPVGADVIRALADKAQVTYS